MPTPHLFALAEAMSDHVATVRFVTLGALDSTRAALGWTSGTSARVIQAHAGDPAAVRGLLADFASPGDVHVLPGLKPARWLRSVQRMVRPSAARVVIMAEAAIPRKGWRASVLGWRERLLAEAWRPRVELVLAMGGIGVSHYRLVGFPREQVHEFGYFPALSETIAPGRSARSSANLAFAGALIPRKGLDVLLVALSLRRNAGWRLLVAGDGPERAALQDQAAALGLLEQVEWLGAVSSGQVPQILAGADCVIVPSRFDGWGAVTNEALGVGTPVVASDLCGSAAVLARAELGGIFPAGDPHMLAKAIEATLAYGRDRGAVRKWAHERLSPAAGASYLARLLAGDCKIGPPWRTASESRP